MTNIGIDVGASELVVATRHKGLPQKKVKAFKNTVAGHQKIINFCSKYLKYGKVKVVMESTGVYYFDLAVALTCNEGFDVMVINPRAAKNFARAAMERNKTDKADALMLALFAETMNYPLWKRPSNRALSVRYYARTINTLVVDKARAKNYFHALEACIESPELLREAISEKITFHDGLIERLTSEAVSIIKQDDQLCRSFELLQTIKGFGIASSIQLLGEIISMPEGMTHKQWVAFAGLDPRQYQSGTSVNKKMGISKAGNRRMRKALFLPAMTAIQHDKHIKAYYNHLLENRSLAKLQAIVAVMRKLLHAIHGMFANLKPFDSKRFYAGPLLG